MKNVYNRYRGKTALLENNLTKKEKETLTEYLTHLSTTAGKQKVGQHRNYLLQFRDIIEKPLTNIKRKDLDSFWALIKSSEHEYNTKIMIKKSIKRFIKWFYKDADLLEGLPVGDYKPNRKRINKTVLLKPAEIKRMLHKAQTLRNKTLIILLYETGARPEEIKRLKWKDINWDEKEIHLDSNKTDRDRDLPIEESIVHLKRWMQEYSFDTRDDNDLIFPNPRNKEKHLTTEQINHLIQALAKQAGIIRPITSYTLRHTRLTEIYVAGVKGIEHNKFAGHKEGSKQQTTYAHIDNEDMKQEILKKVYHVEEISEEKKHELEAKVEKQGNTIKEMQKSMLSLVDEINKKNKFEMGRILDAKKKLNPKKKADKEIYDKIEALSKML